MDVKEQIKDMLEKLSPEAFASAIEMMKRKADAGLIPGVSSNDIEDAKIEAINGGEVDETDEYNDLMEQLNNLQVEIEAAISLYESFDKLYDDKEYDILKDDEKSNEFLKLLEETPLDENILKTNYLKRLMEAEHE